MPKMTSFEQVATGDLRVLARSFVVKDLSFWAFVFEPDHVQLLLRHHKFKILDEIMNAMLHAIRVHQPPEALGAWWDGNRYVVFIPQSSLDGPKEAYDFVDNIRSEIIKATLSSEVDYTTKATCSVAMALCPPDNDILTDVLESLASTLSHYSMPSVTTMLATNTVESMTSQHADDEPYDHVGSRATIAGQPVTFETVPVQDLRVDRVTGFHYVERNGQHSIANKIDEYHKTDPALATTIDVEYFRKVSQFAAMVVSGFTTHINVHPLTLTRVNPNELLSVLRDLNISLEQVAIEVSFKQFPKHYKAMFATLRELRSAGCLISYSDLGWGYSPIEAFMVFQPDFVKFNHNVITGAHQSTYRSQIVRQLVAMMENSGAELIAKGVETSDDNTFVTSLGFCYAQGSYFSQISQSPF